MEGLVIDYGWASCWNRWRQTFPDRRGGEVYRPGLPPELEGIQRGVQKPDCQGVFGAWGSEKGTMMAIWATNVPEWLLTLFAACTKIGAVLVTGNTSI